jgi:hypothetical protein
MRPDNCSIFNYLFLHADQAIGGKKKKGDEIEKIIQYVTKL